MNAELINYIVKFNIDNYVIPIIIIYTYSLIFLIGLNIKIDEISDNLNKIKFLWDNALFQYNFIGVLSTNLFISHRLEYENSIICKKITNNNIIIYIFFLNKLLELSNIFFCISMKKSVLNIITLINPIILMISWMMYINEYQDMYYFIYFNYFIYTFIYLYKIIDINYQQNI
jgi:hypothetical protein